MVASLFPARETKKQETKKEEIYLAQDSDTGELVRVDLDLYQRIKNSPNLLAVDAEQTNNGVDYFNNTAVIRFDSNAVKYDINFIDVNENLFKSLQEWRKFASSQGVYQLLKEGDHLFRRPIDHLR